MNDIPEFPVELEAALSDLIDSEKFKNLDNESAALMGAIIAFTYMTGTDKFTIKDDNSTKEQTI